MTTAKEKVVVPGIKPVMGKELDCNKCVLCMVEMCNAIMKYIRFATKGRVGNCFDAGISYWKTDE